MYLSDVTRTSCILTVRLCSKLMTPFRSGTLFLFGLFCCGPVGSKTNNTVTFHEECLELEKPLKCLLSFLSVHKKLKYAFLLLQCLKLYKATLLITI